MHLLVQFISDWRNISLDTACKHGQIDLRGRQRACFWADMDIRCE